MDFFDGIKDKIPTIGFLSLIISAIYNAGFFSAAASIDLMSSLSYQDIIIASLYVFPILITMIYAFSAINNIIRLEGNIDKKWKYIVLFIIFALGISIIYFTKSTFNSVAWVLVIFSLSPVIYKLLKKLSPTLETKIISIITILFTVCAVSYSSGYESYYKAQCGNLISITTIKCKDCILLKIYSEIIILKNKNSNSILVEKNENELRVDANEQQKAVHSPYCNPLGT